MDLCVICRNSISPAKTILECGHEFCSKCILDNMAKNVGTEEGTSRNKCPTCRATFSSEVMPSKYFTIGMEERLKELTETVEDLKLEHEDRESILETWKGAYKKLRNNNLYLQEELAVEKWRREYRNEVVHKLEVRIKNAYDLLGGCIICGVGSAMVLKILSYDSTEEAVLFDDSFPLSDEITSAISSGNKAQVSDNFDDAAESISSIIARANVWRDSNDVEQHASRSHPLDT